MLRFQIVSIDPVLPTTEIITHDPAGVLYVIERMACKEADVMRNGTYFFSTRLNRAGVWTIFQRFPAQPERASRFA